LATVSAGIATYPLAQTGDLLIKIADQALYQAKHDGRNRIHISDH
jgi:PleD family two-component response regulator